MNPLDSVREHLDYLKGRLVRGELDEASYDRLKEKILADLSPDERAALVAGTPTPRPVAAEAGTPRPVTPANLGPSGGSGRGLRTSIPSLADLDLRPDSILLGQWKLIKELGKGGFGAVFEAEELHLQERQAVKVLDPAMVAKEDLLARFRREVSLMRKLVHPRIVRVYDYREDLSQLIALISMELVTGGSVKQLLAAARAKNVAIPIVLALEILGQTLEALAEAHARGVIHRDVTPGNVLLAGGTPNELLDDPARDPQVKLVDFGIAGLVERSELSQKSRVLGTAAYVAPEVLDPRVEVTPAADVYGAGAMAYELLTGRLPLGRFEEPQALRDEIDPETNDFVLSLLASRPEKRPGARASALGLRKLREEAATSATQQELERRAKREAQKAQETEAAQRRQAESEAKRRQEADRRAAEEQKGRRVGSARVTRPAPRHGEAQQLGRKDLSPGAWGAIALILVALVFVGVWGWSREAPESEATNTANAGTQSGLPLRPKRVSVVPAVRTGIRDAREQPEAFIGRRVEFHGWTSSKRRKPSLEGRDFFLLDEKGSMAQVRALKKAPRLGMEVLVRGPLGRNSEGDVILVEDEETTVLETCRPSADASQSSEVVGAPFPLIEDMREDSKRFLNKVVTIEGIMKPQLLAEAGDYFLRDEWGGLILVRPPGTVPKHRGPAIVTGILKADSRMREIFVEETQRVELDVCWNPVTSGDVN